MTLAKVDGWVPERNKFIQRLKVYGQLHLHYMRNSRTVYVTKVGRQREYRHWVCKDPEFVGSECGTSACMRLKVNV